MTDSFTITALCREFDVTPRTLRFYESKGLLHPHRDGERRRFSTRDRARLKLILRGKRFGLSLLEIGELLDLYNRGDAQISQLSATLKTGQRRLEQMRRQRDELTETIAELEIEIARIDADLKARKGEKA